MAPSASVVDLPIVPVREHADVLAAQGVVGKLHERSDAIKREMASGQASKDPVRQLEARVKAPALEQELLQIAVDLSRAEAVLENTRTVTLTRVESQCDAVIGERFAQALALADQLAPVIEQLIAAFQVKGNATGKPIDMVMPGLTRGQLADLKARARAAGVVV